ncbi:unnamed protein product [Merluccius merluccius]
MAVPPAWPSLPPGRPSRLAEPSHMALGGGGGDAPLSARFLDITDVPSSPNNRAAHENILLNKARGAGASLGLGFSHGPLRTGGRPARLLQVSESVTVSLALCPPVVYLCCVTEARRKGPDPRDLSTMKMTTMQSRGRRKIGTRGPQGPVAQRRLCSPLQRRIVPGITPVERWKESQHGKYVARIMLMNEVTAAKARAPLPDRGYTHINGCARDEPLRPLRSFGGGGGV